MNPSVTPSLAPGSLLGGKYRVSRVLGRGGMGTVLLARHEELDQLFADLRAWARLLADADQVLGVSPLASMPSAAGRTPPHPWHGAASNEEVRRIVGEHLDRLGQHLSVALAEDRDDKVRAALTEVERGILAHRRALSDL